MNFNKRLQELSSEKVNIIKEDLIYLLPHPIEDHAVVELMILKGCVTVESEHYPIRHGKHCGTRVFLGNSYGIIDLNPKFIWNGKDWLLNTFGTFIFAEIEINPPRREEREDN